MAIARADRKPDDFEKNLAQFNKDYSKYDLVFRELYNKVLRPLINDSQLFVEKKVEEAKDAGNYQKPDDVKLPTVPDLEVYESQPVKNNDVMVDPSERMTEFRKPFPAAAKIESEKLPSKEISVDVMPSEREVKLPSQHPATREVMSPQTMRSPVIQGVHVKGLPSIKEEPLNTEKAPSTIKDPNILDEHLQKVRESNANPANSNRNPLFTQMSPGIQSSPTLKPTAHRKFLNSLESLAGESPIILCAYIKKYAKVIEESDPESSIKLFQIANSIKG